MWTSVDPRRRKIGGSGRERGNGAEAGKLKGNWERVCAGCTTTSNVCSLTKIMCFFCLESAEVNDRDTSAFLDTLGWATQRAQDKSKALVSECQASGVQRIVLKSSLTTLMTTKCQ